MPDYLINQLQPEKIGRLFDEPDSDGKKPRSFARFLHLEQVHPRGRYLLLGTAWLAVLLVAGFLSNVLVAPDGIPTVIHEIIAPKGAPRKISLALLQDPIAIIAVIMTLATPSLCVEQIRSIREFNEMNEGNISYRMRYLNVAKINEHVEQANNMFEKLGRRKVSASLLAASLAASFVVDYFIYHWGLLAGWNYTSLTSKSWQREVYRGWWANFPHHLVMAIIFWMLGGYFFYFLSKQIWMGFVFANYARRVILLNFCVSPNMDINTDGYWGLRPLRRFMQTTYSSTLGHFTMVLGILVVWLPFSAYTVLAVIAVLIINMLVVIYPSVIAWSGSVKEKQQYVTHLAQVIRSKSDRDAAIDKVWATPNLPFHLRSSLTAATLYLLIPLMLAVVSGLLGK